MARASNAKSKQDARSVTEATATATGKMLRMAAETATTATKAEKVTAITQLVRMCEEAADHMAQAQTSMFEGRDGGENAIEHLDAALHCLNRMVAVTERRKITQSHAAKSA